MRKWPLDHFNKGSYCRMSASGLTIDTYIHIYYIYLYSTRDAPNDGESKRVLGTVTCQIFLYSKSPETLCKY